MGLLNRFMDDVRGVIFEDSAVDSTSANESSTEETPISAEQLAGCEVDGDISQTVQNMFDEALKELDSAGTDRTIMKVQECMDTWGENCDPTVVLKMLKIAKVDPSVLQADGQARIGEINDLMDMVSVNSNQVIAETAKKADEISQNIDAEEKAYTTDVDALTKKCEEDIKALRDKLQSDISARGQLRDQRMQELASLKSENDKERDDAYALNNAVKQKGAEQIDYVSKLLAMLQTGFEPSPSHGKKDEGGTQQ